MTGLDEGLISTTVAQNSFIGEFDLKADYLTSSERANRLSNITSMVHIGSIPGALFAFVLCEKIGLLWSMRQLCLLWLAGVIIVITSTGTLGQLYAGRFVMGLGIGQAGVVAPTYLAEIAPAHARGMLVSMFAMSEYVGIMIGVGLLDLSSRSILLTFFSFFFQYFSAWGASLHIPNTTARQWIIPQSIQIIVAGLLILSSFLCEESPRFLGKTGHWEKANLALGSLWGLPADNPEVVTEIQGMQIQLNTDYTSSMRGSWFKTVKELLTVRDNQRRILFVISSQVLAQWSGANSLTSKPDHLAFNNSVSPQYSIRTRVILTFRYRRAVGEVVCNCRLWRSQVHRISSLRRLFDRPFRTQAIPLIGNCTAASLHVVYCDLSHGEICFVRRRIGVHEKSRYRIYCIHIHCRYWLGNGMEFYPVSDQCRDIPIAGPVGRF